MKMKSHMRLHECTGCGKQKVLDQRKKHWHNCHPAKFVFMVKSDRDLIKKIVHKFVRSASA